MAAAMPVFDVESAQNNEVLTDNVGVSSYVDPVTMTSLLLLGAYLLRAAVPSLFGQDETDAVGKPLTSRAEADDDWWEFPIHLLALWQLRHQPHQTECARRVICDHVTSGQEDPLFDFAIGGVAYLMGAEGSLSMVDKLQSLEEKGPVDCERLVPECQLPSLRDAKGLGITIKKVTGMMADWMGY